MGAVELGIVETRFYEELEELKLASQVVLNEKANRSSRPYLSSLMQVKRFPFSLQIFEGPVIDW